MAAGAHNSSFNEGIAGRTPSLPAASLFIRLALVPLCVGICYLFSWHFLRSLTADLNVGFDSLLGLHLERVSAEYVAWHGVLYRYVVACTMVDVWFGSLPLVWNPHRTVGQNLGWLAAFAVGSFAFNIFRLSLSDLIFSRGVSWNLAHNALSGAAYFVVWLWLWNNRHSPLKAYRAQGNSHAAPAA